MKRSNEELQVDFYRNVINESEGGGFQTANFPIRDIHITFTPRC